MTSRERFLSACRRQPVDCTPVWFMRQAGRVLPEYRQLKERYSFLEMARNPEMIAEVTLMPLKYLEVDAAIIFADIMLPLDGMGVDYTIRQGQGPVLDRPVRTREQVDALSDFEPAEALGYLMQGIHWVREKLAGEKALIGFAGAPFTLACYLVEGRPSRDFEQVKILMYRAPETWHRLMDYLARMLGRYLRAQVEAGVEAVQLFDSWVGGLSPADYREYVLPYSRQVLEAMQSTGVPTIHFGTGTAGLLPLMAEAGGDVIGIDWRVFIDEAWEAVGPGKGIQGNLDPALLLGPFSKVQERARDILDRVGGRPGHIFNLGHGVLPNASLDNLQRLAAWVHEASARG